MSDMDLMLRSELEALVPIPSAADSSWEDVLRRAASRPHQPGRRRRWSGRRLAVAALAIAALLALAASPVGEAIARGVGDFSAWLTGNPGEPAGEAAQQAFDLENSRSWAAFPDSPKLRRLLAAEAGGGGFALYGFRSGDSLCLRLVVTGIPSTRPATSCAPLEELRRARQPALVVFADYGYGSQDVPPTENGMTPPLASVTAGIVADGIEAVEVETTDGRQSAIVGSNAFLAVTPKPPLGFRATGAVATSSESRRWTIPLARAPFDLSGPPATSALAPGPTLGERLFHLADRERAIFVRVIRPDPEGSLRVAIGRVEFSRDQAVNPHAEPGQYVCYYLLTPAGGAGGGCDHFGRQFETGPFSLGMMSDFGGDQYVHINGLASDDVDRLTLFLGDGQEVVIPLRDNAYAIDVSRNRFPIRVVGYDDDGKVIGIETYGADPLADTGARPVDGSQRLTKRVTGPNGVTVTLFTGPATDGGRCARIAFENGAGSSFCIPKHGKTPRLAVGLQRNGGDAFLTGHSDRVVKSVTVSFEGARELTAVPLDGFLLEAIPGRLRGAGPLLAVGYDAEGKAVARQRLGMKR